VDKIAKPGERVRKNSVLARVHASSRAQAGDAILRLKPAFEISAKPPKIAPLISEIII
jgi:thymidine phosphorylase